MHVEHAAESQRAPVAEAQRINIDLQRELDDRTVPIPRPDRAVQMARTRARSSRTRVV
ncbi:hypothetical protein QX204_21210 [Nocardia sp. PE-7]|uniref:hypothetical protein n=1 Tax=Nocardia sp. PE-7 TaxID=3058426 RepID=UPI00265AA4D3|nr:hypothetical protein [Nocardia sp. PE-7]WKG07613.1 hypothetical protein QX204_21210 [Nocardia sp. PE-7]